MLSSKAGTVVCSQLRLPSLKVGRAGKGWVNQNCLHCALQHAVAGTAKDSLPLRGSYPMTLTILDPLTGKTVTITVPSGKAR